MPTPRPHPTDEDWMSFLYNETPQSQAQPLRNHLNDCAACQETVKRWRQVMGGLTSWQITPSPRQARPAPRLLPWAAAAALAISLGFAAGVWTARSGPNARELTAQLREEIRTNFVPQVTQSLAGQFRAEWQDALDKSQAQLTQALNEQQSQQLAAYVVLRRDLENLAVATQTALGRAYRQLGQLTAQNQNENDTVVPANNVKTLIP